MPTQTKSQRKYGTADENDSNESSAPVAVMLSTPLDAPPSFLERNEPAPRETAAPLERSNLQLYLQEIGKTALLTPKEEVQLARRIRKGIRPLVIT